MPNFTTPDGELSGLFITDADILDRYVGNQLWMWGENSGSSVAGQLGDNTTTNKSSPVQTVSTGTNWKQLSCGSFHTAAIKTDGTLWLWGSNSNGQLGNNSTTDRSSPVQTVSGGSNWKQVSVGSVSAAIKTDGTLWLWGPNSTGALGNNSTTSRSSPVQTVSGGSNWKQVSIGCQSSTVAAIKTDGTLWLWGNNSNGQLGNNSTTSRSSPVQTVSGGSNWKQVASGVAHVAAVKTDGTLWIWGSNYHGKLGDNTITHRSSPVQTVSTGTNWKQVACGESSSAAIKTDGTLWTWGRAIALGDNSGTATHKSSPVQTVAGGTNWKQVECGDDYAAAIKTDGTLWTWGDNTPILGGAGRLGNNSTSDKSSPVQTVAQGTNWKQLSCGDSHMGAVTYTES